jgi:hypothetical protein
MRSKRYDILPHTEIKIVPVRESCLEIFRNLLPINWLIDHWQDACNDPFIQF